MEEESQLDRGNVKNYMEKIKVKCDSCDGYGYTAEHNDPSSHGEDGECLNCPVQVQCENCEGTGKYETVKM